MPKPAVSSRRHASSKPLKTGSSARPLSPSAIPVLRASTNRGGGGPQSTVKAPSAKLVPVMTPANLRAPLRAKALNADTPTTQAMVRSPSVGSTAKVPQRSLIPVMTPANAHKTKPPAAPPAAAAAAAVERRVHRPYVLPAELLPAEAKPPSPSSSATESDVTATDDGSPNNVTFAANLSTFQSPVNSTQTSFASDTSVNPFLLATPELAARFVEQQRLSANRAKAEVEEPMQAQAQDQAIVEAVNPEKGFKMGSRITGMRPAMAAAWAAGCDSDEEEGRAFAASIDAATPSASERSCSTTASEQEREERDEEKSVREVELELGLASPAMDISCISTATAARDVDQTVAAEWQSMASTPAAPTGQTEDVALDTSMAAAEILKSWELDASARKKPGADTSVGLVFKSAAKAMGSSRKPKAAAPVAENVEVICRFRPRSAAEAKQHGGKSSTSVQGDGRTVSCTDHDKHIQFTFGRAFEQESTQAEVYEQFGAGIVSGLLDGINSAVLAYGQTGAGKTHTMVGPDDGQEATDGMIPRLASDLFAAIESAKASVPFENSGEVQFTVRASMIEIYMERVRDLLSNKRSKAKKGAFGSALDRCEEELPLRENTSGDGGVWLDGAEELDVTSYADVRKVMDHGFCARMTGSTTANDNSSRGHAIFMLHVDALEVATMTHKTATLSCVDLAGSEKVAKAETGGLALDEAKKINTSLLALGNVIFALQDAHSEAKRGRRKSEYVGYRDSKLTRLLKTSIGGNSHTVMLVCCSPATYNVSETLSTLRFGDRSQKVRNEPRKNVRQSPRELVLQLATARATVLAHQIKQAELEEQLEQVQRENGAMRKQLALAQGMRALFLEPTSSSGSSTDDGSTAGGFALVGPASPAASSNASVSSSPPMLIASPAVAQHMAGREGAMLSPRPQAQQLELAPAASASMMSSSSFSDSVLDSSVNVTMGALSELGVEQSVRSEGGSSTADTDSSIATCADTTFGIELPDDHDMYTAGHSVNLSQLGSPASGGSGGGGGGGSKMAAAERAAEAASYTPAHGFKGQEAGFGALEIGGQSAEAALESNYGPQRLLSPPGSAAGGQALTPQRKGKRFFTKKNRFWPGKQLR